MEVGLVMHALDQLIDESPVWTKNYHIFIRMTLDEKERWWQHAQQMSKQGLPMYRTLVAKVIQLRMS